MSQLGRISGPLLKDNLVRNGVDLAFETDLLYLDVINGQVGIRADSPVRTFTVNGKALTTDLIVDNLIEVSGNTGTEIRNDNSITSLSTPLTFSASTRVTANTIQTAYLRFDDNVISNLVSNSNVELRSTGSLIDIYSNVKVNGDFYASGDITFDGDITIGGSNSQSVITIADVGSDLLPDVSGLTLGQSGARWKDAYSHLFSGTNFILGGITSGGANLATRPGKTWFVATNGSDTNVGNHEQGPFASLSKALSESQDGDTVFVYPGTYTETFPLTVPTGVTIAGVDIRTCIIVPSVATNNNDAFLVNGETTITGITIKDFYYDSVNNTGHAFRFADGFKVTTRSPYIQNVTVITKGSVVSAADPRGFETADAGRGAYIDGSVADTDSNEASMLFHSCTFLTPGVDCITMLNGVRVEWLNGFTYFANRGLYALNGSAGFAGESVRFGAEIRSIGSANIYGNYGTWADGDATLMYLIMHNFAYVGTGKDSSNDNFLHIEENDVTELNSGRIVYQSTDQKGKFKVGDAFYVDFETGTTSINVGNAGLTGLSSLTIGSGDQITFITSTKVDTGNLSFTDNEMFSKGNEVNIVAADGEVNLSTNVRIQKDLFADGNLSLSGKITVGGSTTDTVDFNSAIADDITPKVNNLYSLGSVSKQWNSVFLENAFVGDFDIYDNVITTNESNINLNLIASGTGRITVPVNNIEFGQDLTVAGTTYFNDGYSAEGNVSITGNRTQIGNIQRTGSTSMTGTITVASPAGIAAQFADIQFNSNVITTTLSNSDLEFSANGTGIVKILSNDVKAVNALHTDGNISTGTFTTTGSLTANTFTDGNVTITGNVVRTTTTPSNLVISASGIGRVVVPTSDVVFDQSFTMFGTGTGVASNLANTIIDGNTIHAGEFKHTGTSYRIGATSVTGGIAVGAMAQFQDIRLSTNVISTTSSNNNFELRAVGAGIVKFPTNNVRFSKSLAVSLAINAGSILLSNGVTANQFSTGNILIDNNYIATTTTPSNLRLLANATGKVYLPSNSAKFDNNLTVIGTTNLRATTIGALGDLSTLTILGNITQTGGTQRTGAVGITGNLTVASDTQAGTVLFKSNYVTSTTVNSDLELRANGTGVIRVPTANVRAFRDLSVNGTATLASVQITNTITALGFNTGDISISGNTITTTIGSNDLKLQAIVPGNITVTNNNTVFDKDLTVNTITAFKTTNISNTVTHVGALSHTGSRTHVGSYGITGNLTTSANANFQNVSIVNNAIRTNDSNSDLELYAAGSGRVRVPLDNVYISNKLSVVGLTSTANINSSGTIISNQFRTSDILIDDNFITSISGSSNLKLLGAGTGGVKLELLKFNNTEISTDSGNYNIIITPGTASGVILDTPTALRVPVGTVANRPVTIPGDFRFNSVDSVFSGWNRDFGGVYSSDRKTYAKAHTSNNTISFYSKSNLSLEVLTDRIWVVGVVVDNNLSLSTNTIRNTVVNQDILLSPNGSGEVVVNEIRFSGNELINENNSTPLTFRSTGDGYLKFPGTAGLVIPVGDTNSQPANPEEGDVRFNTELDYAEVYSETHQAYIPITGMGDVVSQELMQELGDLWALILG